MCVYLLSSIVYNHGEQNSAAGSIAVIIVRHNDITEATG